MMEIATESARAIGETINLGYNFGIIIVFLLSMLIGLEVFK